MTITVPEGAHLIGGDWSTDAPGGRAVSENPARPDEPVGEYPLGDAGTASDAVGAAVDQILPQAKGGDFVSDDHRCDGNCRQLVPVPYPGYLYRTIPYL